MEKVPHLRSGRDHLYSVVVTHCRKLGILFWGGFPLARLLPHLVPRSTIGTKLALILAFGDLSHLEACTVFANELLEANRLSEDVLMVELMTTKDTYERLAGVHKVVVPITTLIETPEDATEEVEGFLKNLDDDFSFSVSYYSSQGVDESEYESMVSLILSIVRDNGFRKANLIRPRGGPEVYAREIISRKITDFVIIRAGGRYLVGVTAYIPDAAEFRERSNERPVVSSQISISSRLAKVLVNLGGLSKGQMVLDPFCGSGTILAEAMLAGVNCVGVDKNPTRIENAKRNLEWVSSTSNRHVGSYSLSVKNAMDPRPLLEGGVLADAVVTEPILLPRIDYPPRLDKGKKMIRNASRLYSESLYSIAASVRVGGRVVIVAPSLRTAEKKDVSVTLQDLDEIGLKTFRPPKFSLDYPVHIGHENTKWIRRLVYVFEHT